MASLRLSNPTESAPALSSLSLPRFARLRREGDSKLTVSVHLLAIFSFESNLAQKLFESAQRFFTKSCAPLPLLTSFTAERGGFEPPIRFRVYYLSKVARSTALPSLRDILLSVLQSG